jgi:hypothetical protein
VSLALRQRLVDIALAECGLKEVLGEPNTGADVVKYQQATTLAPGPWPWCSAFVAWCMQQWLQAPDVQRALGIPEATHPPLSPVEEWRFKSARAFEVEVWAKQRGLLVLGEEAPALLGDLITFDFSHIGIVTRDEVPGQPLETVEGNTNGAGSREGDGVYRKRRPDSLTRRYVRLLP